MDKLKISSRLYFGFGLVIVLIIAMTVLGYFSLSKASTETAESVSNFSQSVTLQRGLKDLANARAALWIAIAFQSEADLEQRKLEIAEATKKLEDGFQKSTARLNEVIAEAQDAEHKASAQQLLNLISAYRLQTLKLLEVSHSGIDSDDFRSARKEAAATYVKIADLSTPLALAYIDRADATGKDSIESAKFSSHVELAIGIFAWLLGSLSALLVSGSITKPLTGIVNAVQALGRGEKNTPVEAANRQDELGPLGVALEHWRQSLIADELREADERAAQQRQLERQKRVDFLTQNFDKSVSEVLDTVAGASTELEATASSMAAGAEQTTRQASTVASATDQASHAVETVAAAAEELSASINEIGRQVTESSTIASNASDEAGRTNQRVQALAETASKIGDVINLINDIAAQTNLLALNATIEAARAGDAGKGFAVVANEVKNLANQTARATDEIGQQIASVQSQTQEAVDAIGLIVARIEEINHIAAAIAAAVEEQSAATAEIAGNVQQAAQSTNLVAGNIGGVSDAASMTGAASQQVLSSARSLSGDAERLKAVVSAFLQDVRSA